MLQLLEALMDAEVVSFLSLGICTQCTMDLRQVAGICLLICIICNSDKGLHVNVAVEMMF